MPLKRLSAVPLRRRCVSLETYLRRRGDVLMGRRHYVSSRCRHDIPIRRCEDVPLRRLGDVPLRRRWDVQRNVVMVSPRRLVAGWDLV